MDGLRAVAIVLVIVFHASAFEFKGGWIGVDIFFVLSGYLITSILSAEFDQHRHILFGRFYLRRFLRLAPALFLLLAVNVAVTLPFSPRADEQILNTLAALFYFMNWLRAFDLGFGGNLGHVWSLSVEEQFYLVWPVFLFASLVSGGRRFAFFLAIASIIGITIWRTHLIEQGASIMRTYNGFDTRADTILFGAVLALSPDGSWRRALARSWALPAGTLAVLSCVAPWNERWVHLFGFTVVGACSAWIICSLVYRDETKLKAALRQRTMVFLGTISYGMYLWHALFTSLFFARGLQPPLVLLIIMPLTIATATASFYLVEQPFLRLKDRLASTDERKAVTP